MVMVICLKDGGNVWIARIDHGRLSSKIQGTGFRGSGFAPWVTPASMVEI